MKASFVPTHLHQLFIEHNHVDYSKNIQGYYGVAEDGKQVYLVFPEIRMTIALFDKEALNLKIEHSQVVRSVTEYGFNRWLAFGLPTLRATTEEELEVAKAYWEANKDVITSSFTRAVSFLGRNTFTLDLTGG